MLFLALATVMYFLPSILGHNKRNAAGIFLVNFFLGWTIVGWVIALFWACTADARMPVMVVAGPGHYCSQCGTASIFGARYCATCGRPV
ncbi:MAG: superinfection immunity protein [Candidatus Acidiferrales bacterium]|jgi:Superinfection immunity protein